jgi:hypothetical protein
MFVTERSKHQVGDIQQKPHIIAMHSQPMQSLL